MGVSYSNSLTHYQNEVDTKFLRPLEASVASHQKIADRSFEERSRKVLFTYPSLLLLSFMDGMSIDLGHLAVLFVLDGDKDGLFSWQDIASFVEWVHTTIPTDEKNLGNDFREAVRARCVLRMWRECIYRDQQHLKPPDSDLSYGGGRSDGQTDVVSAMSSPESDNLLPERSASVTSRDRFLPSSVDGRTPPNQEVFELWFERFLSKNFPFESDRAHQITPLSFAEVSRSGQARGGNAGSRRLSTSSCDANSPNYNSLVVDAAGLDSIAISEVSPLELRQQPKSLSLDALSAAYVLMAVKETANLRLRGFCEKLIGKENLQRQGENVACPARALRAFNSAFIEGYWARLRNYDLQPLL